MQFPIKILYINGGLMNRGGIESYMMNYYRHFDHKIIQIDFVVHNAGGYGYYDEEIKNLGGQIFTLPQKKQKSFKLYNYVKNNTKKRELQNYSYPYGCHGSVGTKGSSKLWYSCTNRS